MSFVWEFLHTLLMTIRDVTPIMVIIFGFQFAILKKPIANPVKVMIGFAYVIVGLSLFLVGLELALFPLGETMAMQLTAPDFLNQVRITLGGTLEWIDYYWVFLFAFCIGFSTTIAEPSLLAVAIKANQVSAGAISVNGLRIAVALGVAVGIALGSYRIVVGDPIHYYIIAGYILVVIQTYYAPKFIVPLAYDSGGVTTSTVTVPLVTALGLGLASTVPGRNPMIDGFGLIAFASLFPIISVMAYAQLTQYLTLVLLPIIALQKSRTPNIILLLRRRTMRFKLILAFVEDSKTEQVLDAARDAGATGATVINNARGEGLNKKQTFFGLTLEVQKDVVLFVVEEHLSRHILETISQVGEFDQTSGQGIAVQIDIEDAVGVAHQVETLTKVVEDEL